MRKHVILSLGLWILSCSQQANPGTSTSGIACSLTKPCADTSKVCDFLVPSTLGGNDGTCRQACNPTAPSPCSTDPNNPVCNPISGACEPNCGVQPASNFCQNQLPGTGGLSVSPVCVSNRYCALADISPNQGACSGTLGLKGSGGFCKIPCRTSLDCPGSWQTCDVITKTCEVQCNTQTINACTSASYPTSGSTTSTTTQISLACSEITATCVPSCTVSSTGGQNTTCTNVDSNRINCYSPGYQTTVSGTCEKPCTNPTSCGSDFACAEGVCQTQCAADSGCTINPKRTRCDPISGACAIGCSNNTTCTSHGLACSPVSATCVAGCVVSPGSSPGSSPCPTQDTLRNGCVQAFIGFQDQNYANCEIGCTGWPAIHDPPVRGSCKSSLSCALNPNQTPGYVNGYCGILCTSENNACNILGHSQTCRASSTCSL